MRRKQRRTVMAAGKGGDLKTTTDFHLVVGIPRVNLNLSSLAVDYDPSGNLSSAFGINPQRRRSMPTIYHVLSGKKRIEEVIQHTQQGDIIIGNQSLKMIEGLFTTAEEKRDGLFGLKNELEKLPYTHIIMDNQPTTSGFLVYQTLIAATDIVVPLQADKWSLEGLDELQIAIDYIKGRYNPDLFIDGILLTKIEEKTTVAKSVMRNIKRWSDRLDTKVYKAFISKCEDVKKGNQKGINVFDYSPRCSGAIDYWSFIEEYLKSERGK